MPARVAAVALVLIATATGDAALAAGGSSDTGPPLLVLQGGTDSEIAAYGLGVMWQVPILVETLSPYGLDVRLGADVLRWDSLKSGDTGNSFLWDFGLTPYLRWRPGDTAWRNFFVQGGLGVHIISHTAINPGRTMSTAFQFGEALAVGANLGPRNRYEITAFMRHVSNADIKRPNWGFTYYGVTLGIPLD